MKNEEVTKLINDLVASAFEGGACAIVIGIVVPMEEPGTIRWEVRNNGACHNLLALSTEITRHVNSTCATFKPPEPEVKLNG